MGAHGVNQTSHMGCP